MNGQREIRCPQCGGTELDSDRLTTWGAQDQIFFGSQLFRKSRLVGYACNDCDYVFLYRKRTEEVSDSDA